MKFIENLKNYSAVLLFGTAKTLFNMLYYFNDDLKPYDNACNTLYTVWKFNVYSTVSMKSEE